MKNYKNRYQGFVYVDTNLEQSDVTERLKNFIPSDFLHPDRARISAYVQDMNKLRDKQFYQKVGGKYHPLRW